MLTSWGRVLTRTAGLSAFKSLPVYKAVIPVGQSIPRARGLATATAPKKAANTKKTTTTTTTTTTKAAKAPIKATATSTTKKAAPTAKAAETAEKPTRKPKKTEEEKQKEHIKSLIEKALDPPDLTTKSAWVCFLKEKFEAAKGTGESVGVTLKREHSNWSNEYKNLTPAQLEALQGRATHSKGNKEKVFLDWVKQHTPAQIHQANVARSALRSIKARGDPVPRGLKGNRFAAIPDDRYPLRARSPNVLYVKEKIATIPKEKKVEALPTLMKEFTALPETEKQKWRDLAAKDVVRYHTELKRIGIQPNL